MVKINDSSKINEMREWLMSAPVLIYNADKIVKSIEDLNTIDNAAKFLLDKPYLVSVGINNNDAVTKLIVYIATRKYINDVPRKWCGYEVVTKVM